MVNVTDANASESLKESSLEAIGYICQDIVSYKEEKKREQYR